MCLLCSQTNRNSSPDAAFTITVVVLEQFFIRPKSQDPQWELVVGL